MINQAPQQPVKAIGLMLLAVFMLSSMDVVLKMLVEHYDSLQVVFFRCVVSAPVLMVWILFTGREQFRTAYPKGHLLRAVVGLGMLYALGECFREMQLTDAYALFFAAPLLVTLLSGVVLGEPAGMFRTVASVVGFSGVLIVLKPSGGNFLSYGALMGLVAVVLYAFTALLLRRMGSRDGTATIAFWFVTLVGLGAGVLAIPVWQPLNTEHWPLLLVMGITGTLGQVLLTAAFRRASVAVVAPFDYTHMIWALIYGYFFWGYLPGVQTWVGTTILIASGLFIIYREKQSISRQRSIEK